MDIKVWMNENAWFILKCLGLIVMLIIMVIAVGNMIHNVFNAPVPDWANITSLEG